MKVNRRSFVKATVTSSAALLLPDFDIHQNTIKLPSTTSLKIMATNWGFDGSIEQFCTKAKQAGYDGVELGWPAEPADQKKLLDAAKANQLSFAFLVGVWDKDDYTSHLKSFEKKLHEAIATQPLYINCHAGKDHFSWDQNLAFMSMTSKLSADFKIPIYHETHRGRILYSAPIAKNYIDKIPDLRLTLDISHWCAVHESLLSDQAVTIEQALKKTEHIHARIGHPEGPQVSDPRAPEWAKAVEAHFAWWDEVVKNKIANGSTTITFLTEFGPPDYLPTLPFTRQPVANQWDINIYMMHTLRKRYVTG
ncbi:MAG TPA: sugar phosphate isomerase/epimerase [Cyclobacteriaceae bacterium]|nr:sugar phosphate isomerase/epimerase [Cyclobacteriaceae bacterium]